MKGLFWNIRGMGDHDKIKHLNDLIKEHKVDFIGIQETVKQDFTAKDLDLIGGGGKFSWNWTIPRGRSGGMLVGINEDKMEIMEVSKKNFLLHVKVKNRNDKFVWRLITVYGAAQPEHKEEFLRELAQDCYGCDEPLLIGGDFNILRQENEKNKRGGVNKWSLMFNSIIENANLREMALEGKKFTWANNKQSVTLEKLDRILFNDKWEIKFPLACGRVLERIYSDHTPLLINVEGEKWQSPLFKFENSWLMREDINTVVEQVWNSYNINGSSIDKWQWRLQKMRKKLKGWNMNWEGMYKRKKHEIMEKIEDIDKKCEAYGMTILERKERGDLEEELKKVVREDRLKWMQRCKEKKPFGRG